MNLFCRFDGSGRQLFSKSEDAAPFMSIRGWWGDLGGGLLEPMCAFFQKALDTHVVHVSYLTQRSPLINFPTWTTHANNLPGPNGFFPHLSPIEPGTASAAAATAAARQ